MKLTIFTRNYFCSTHNLVNKLEIKINKSKKMNFRKTYQVLHKEVIQWFPGHMGKGLKQMQQKLKTVDCIIEVHDSRIPFSGRNEEFKYTISGVKPHILVLNKKDLIDKRSHTRIVDKLKAKDDQHVLLTNCQWDNFFNS